MENCLFCKINSHAISSDTLYEDGSVHVFSDIHPKAPIHFLIVPKKHIESVLTLDKEDAEIVSNLIFTAKKIADQKKLQGYKLLFNVGRRGGQLIDHIHLHCMGGWNSDAGEENA